jgi:hypothetical protein
MAPNQGSGVHVLAHGILRGKMPGQRVGRGKEDALMTVFPPDEIRRPAPVTMDLHDHTLTLFIPHVTSPDHQLIAHSSAHRNRLLSTRRHHEATPAPRTRAEGPWPGQLSRRRHGARSGSCCWTHSWHAATAVGRNAATASRAPTSQPSLSPPLSLTPLAHPRRWTDQRPPSERGLLHRRRIGAKAPEWVARSAAAGARMPAWPPAGCRL